MLGKSNKNSGLIKIVPLKWKCLEAPVSTGNESGTG